MNELPPLGDVLSLMRLIWGLNRGLELASRRMQAQLGVTGPQRLALRIIGRFPGITGSELSAILHLDPSTTSTMLAALSAKRLVSRKSDSDDRRRVRLSLTAKGKQLDLPTPETVEAGVTAVLHEVSHAELEYGSRLLKRLGDVLRGADASPTRKRPLALVEGPLE